MKENKIVEDFENLLKADSISEFGNLTDEEKKEFLIKKEELVGHVVRLLGEKYLHLYMIILMESYVLIKKNKETGGE